jgi:phosphoribosylamine--glycine ligase
VMKILIIDPQVSFLDLAMRAQDSGHTVRLYLPPMMTGKKNPSGDGIVDKVSAWMPHMKWADLIILGDNVKYAAELEQFFKKGYPLFGCNQQAAELELDRKLGMEVLEKFKIPVLPYKVFRDYDEAIAFVSKTKKAYASKPWGGSSDKALSYVADSAKDLVFKLTQWKKEGKLKGAFMLQEKCKGIEMAVGGWFGPSGWGKNLCENFEFKKLLNDDLGQNTGEQGTVLRYVQKSKLFDEVLEPVTDYLHGLKYTGYVDMNAMVEEGKPKPLEFTMRFGVPTQIIQSALHRGDPVEWMADLLEGRDTLRASDDIALGVAIYHGDFPHSHMTGKELTGIPIYGITAGNMDNLHFFEVMHGQVPQETAGGITWVKDYVTAGDEIMIVVGTGKTVEEAYDRAYKAAWQLKIPSNKGMRTDIGCRLEDELPELQKHGYAKGMRYG